MNVTPIERNQSLWNAIESYAARVKVTKLFTNDDLQSVRDMLTSIPLTEEQQERIEGCIASLNSPPLMERLFALAQQDGLAIDDFEGALLERLRVCRNDAVHGRDRAEPTKADLDFATGVLARLLMFRWFKKYALDLGANA